MQSKNLEEHRYKHTNLHFFIKYIMFNIPYLVTIYYKNVFVNTITNFFFFKQKYF